MSMNFSPTTLLIAYHLCTMDEIHDEENIEKARRNLLNVTPEEQEEIRQELNEKLEELSENGRKKLEKYEIIEQIHPKPCVKPDAVEVKMEEESKTNEEVEEEEVAEL